MLTINTGFHQVIYEASHNEMLEIAVLVPELSQVQGR